MDQLLQTTSADDELIQKIVSRARRNHPFLVPDALALEMDLAACHQYGCRLELQRLLDADDWSFVHDIGGIQLHIDRKSGQLLRFFRPRFACRCEAPFHPEID